MLISTTRYINKKTNEFAISFANAFCSYYCARSKKTIEQLVSEARKKGENTVALFSSGINSECSYLEIFFISVFICEWNWKKEFLRIMNFKICDNAKMEIDILNGKDSLIFEKLFGLDSFYGGEAILFAENGKLTIMNDETIILELGYEVILDEKQCGINS